MEEINELPREKSEIIYQCLHCHAKIKVVCVENCILN